MTVTTQPIISLQNRTATKQRALLDSWIAFLSKFEEIELIWIEGSLIDPERENPGSDIDIRFAIRDDAFEDLWDSNRYKIFDFFEETLQIAPFRFLTDEGILIEYDAFLSSEVNELKLFEWEILLNRLETGQPKFQRDSTTGAAKWPYPQQTNEKFVTIHTQEVMRTLSIASTPFFRATPHAALFSLDLLKMNLAHFLYWRAGIKPFRRFKHLQQIFTAEILADFEYVQFKPGENALDYCSIAKATLRTFEMLIKYVEIMHQEVDIDFPEKWMNLLFKKLASELQPFVEN